jgi:hypothetical protein
MSREIKADYQQLMMFPPLLEDWVGPEHPARFIRDLVDSLDLPGLGFRVRTAEVRRQRIQEALQMLATADRDHLHPGEPEARLMKVGAGVAPAYNAQVVADGASGLLVAAEVVNAETDNQQLVPMLDQVQENLGARFSAMSAPRPTAGSIRSGFTAVEIFGIVRCAASAAGTPKAGNWRSARIIGPWCDNVEKGKRRQSCCA